MTCFTQAKGHTLGPSGNLAGPRDVPCDLCSPQKLKSVTSRLACTASLCEKHLCSHFEDRVFRTTSCWSPCGISRAACARSIASCGGYTAARRLLRVRDLPAGGAGEP